MLFFASKDENSLAKGRKQININQVSQLNNINDNLYCKFSIVLFYFFYVFGTFVKLVK